MRNAQTVTKLVRGAVPLNHESRMQTSQRLTTVKIQKEYSSHANAMKIYRVEAFGLKNEKCIENFVDMWTSEQFL